MLVEQGVSCVHRDQILAMNIAWILRSQSATCISAHWITILAWHSQREVQCWTRWAVDVRMCACAVLIVSTVLRWHKALRLPWFKSFAANHTAQDPLLSRSYVRERRRIRRLAGGWNGRLRSTATRRARSASARATTVRGALLQAYVHPA
jgi:hypothetical protein